MMVLSCQIHIGSVGGMGDVYLTLLLGFPDDAEDIVAFCCQLAG